jgi:hypothetical protein
MAAFDISSGVPDAFSLTQLTASINALPYLPGQIAEMGLFSEEGINTTSALIESRNGVLSLVPVMPRNAPGTPVVTDKRKGVSFAIPHLPATGSVMADEVQNMRAFGSESEADTVDSIRDRHLARMRANIDLTMETHRLSAIKGSFYDASGAVTSLFTTFGVSQSVLGMVLLTATTEIEAKCQAIFELMEAALDGSTFTGVTAFCGSNFWSKLITHPLVKATYANTQMASALRRDPRLSFEFGGITWTRYRGNSAANIATDEAYCVPTGVPDLFITRFAPANYVETVNTIGLPYYSKAELMQLGKGLMLEAQSNPLNICTRPAASVKLTTT